MTVTYIQTSSVGVLETSCSMAEVSAMLDGTADAPVVGGPRLIAIDVGGDTIALDAAGILAYQGTPFDGELTAGDELSAADQAAAAEAESTRRRGRKRSQR